MLSNMRTTVTLDDDSREVIRQRMARMGVSFKQAINDAIRESGAEHRPPGTPFRTPTFALGRPTVDLTKALALAADMEDEELVRKMAIGK